MKNFKLKIILSISAFIIFYLAFFDFSYAQTPPQFLISWKTQNYAPNWYAGKILPTAGTQIEVNFELIDNGKLADISGTKVRWYINDKLVKNENNGLGIKKINFTAPNYFGQTIEVRIAIVDFLGGGFMDKIIEIPVVRPEAVINAPYKNNEIKTGKSAFSVSPFFFNINNKDYFSVQWSVSGQKPESDKGDIFSLDLNIDQQMPAGSDIGLSVTVNNILKTLEMASQTINLTVK